MRIIDHIYKVANDLDIDTRNKSNEGISLCTSSYLGLSLIITCDNDENVTFYYTQRTTSWVYNGERTDLHDVIPIAFAIFIKRFGICSLYFTDVYNPATCVDDEIYSKYLTPFQINDDFINKNTAKYTEFINNLVSSLVIFEKYFWQLFSGCPCEDCRKKAGYDFEYNWEIEEAKVKKVMKSIDSSEELVNYCERTLPTWFYFRDFKKKISIIQSPDLHPFISYLIKSLKIVHINSFSGKLFIEDQCHHYLGNTKDREIRNVFKKLGDKFENIILFENRAIAIGNFYIISFNYDCGFNKFQIEKDKLKLRHDKEYRILFKPSNFEWKDKIDGERFENLIKDLLEREPNVIRVRKTSHTKERDSGVDLIADWNVPNVYSDPS